MAWTGNDAKDLASMRAGYWASATGIRARDLPITLDKLLGAVNLLPNDFARLHPQTDQVTGCDRPP